MVDFEKLKGVFAKLPEEPAPLIDEEKENTLRVVAAYTMRLLFNGN